MAESTSAAARSPVSGEDLARAEKFTFEPFVHEGDDPAVVLAEGTPRRRALDEALGEIDAGLKQPSIPWRQKYSLMLGLERLMSQDEPRLADGETTLNAHQVDALSGTMIALISEVQRSNGVSSNGAGPNGALAAEDELVEPDGDEEDEDWDGEEDSDSEPADWNGELDDDAQMPEQPEDPNAARRFWFEHATGAGKTVAAMGFVDASRSGGILILTHRRNLVDQFLGELKDRGYKKRIQPEALLKGQDKKPRDQGPVTVETYQWFVRNAGNVSDAYTIVICDEAHTALGEKTSASIRQWAGPVFIGMTATGALIARHVTDLFPTQTSRFDLAQAARRGVIAPLRCVRIPPGVGVRSIAKVPLRKGEVDQDFDQEELAALLDQAPFNLAVADLYRARFKDLPGVVYAAGVKHAYNVAKAFQEVGIKAKGVSGETPKRELARILASYEAGEIDVLVNAQLLAEGWNSPRATVCMHLAPTASKRIYQQRVGRVTRRQQGKEAGIVVDFVHPATTHDDPVVTLHSLLDRDVYRGGAIVVGPIRRGRGRRLRVERRVLPVTPDPERRAVVFERELWRIAVEHLPWGEQHVWAALAGARVSSGNWRRAKAMLHFDQTGELRRRFLLTCLQRNRNSQLRLRALSEVGAGRDAEAFDEAVVIVGTWSRDERREGVKILLQSLAERPIGRRDQASAWLWHLAEFSREVHEEYAVQRWPETKRLLGLLVNSSGGAHARNARRLVQAARKQDRRLQAALLAAALAHTPEAEEVLRGARMRLARKPSALARELLRNFPKGRRGRRRRRRGGKGEGAENGAEVEATAVLAGAEAADGAAADADRDTDADDDAYEGDSAGAVADAELDTEADDGDQGDRPDAGGESEAVIGDKADGPDARGESDTDPAAAAVSADEEPPAPKKRRSPRKRVAAKTKAKAPKAKAPKAKAPDPDPDPEVASADPSEGDDAASRGDDLDRAA